MSSHKAIDRICCAAMALVLVITVLFMNGEKMGLVPVCAAMGYEERIFDTSRVHTVDIVMDDWEGFLATATSEEYATCAVIIDGESYKNVAMRAKGNTSLSSVRAYGNNRYSFKIEFDHYESGNTYHGLDKLVLNNLIQDNTMMKDYLTYQMMLSMGAAAPLCSFAYITVNGEDWGLYLAIEAIEDSFLRRNYGNDHGELYKPDSMNMGGGDRGENKGGMPDFGNFQMPEGMQPPEGMKMPEGFTPGEGISPTVGDTMPGFDKKTMPFGEETVENEGNTPTTPPQSDENRQNRQNRGGFGGMMGGGGALLSYTDDEYDSYSTIFNSAKTDIDDSDKARLIESLKRLSEGTDLENTVDIDGLMRYFTVHNFVVNFDSYTGSMIHNYYLYEEDGVLCMLPWDYNLGFGGFQGNDVLSMINYPVDEPVSGGNTAERPMIAWIFASDVYTQMYREYMDRFITEYFESVYFDDMMKSSYELISPYVERDPTKFCTYDEFEKGFETLLQFCLKRAESVRGQLSGTIPSTSAGQRENSTALVSADGIAISDMGSMGMGGGRGGNRAGFTAPASDDKGTEENTSQPQAQQPQLDIGEGQAVQQGQNSPSSGTKQPQQQNQQSQREGMALGRDFASFQGNTAQPNDNTNIILLCASLVILLGGILFAALYKRR